MKRLLRVVDPSKVIAILSKTVGSGAANDYSRAYLEVCFARHLSSIMNVSLEWVLQNILMITSAGCEGIISPHGYVIYREEGEDGSRSRSRGLCVGTSRSQHLESSEIGGMKQVRLVEEAVRSAMSQASIASGEDIGVVFVKSPIGQGASQKRSISLTRAASAIGVGLALGEIDESDITQEKIGTDFSIFSRKAFTLSGNELDDCRVMVLGEALGGNPVYSLHSSVIESILDADSVYKVLKSLDSDEQVVGFFVKISEYQSRTFAGRTLALSQSDLPVGRELRAAASGVFSVLTGSTDVFISVGGEHQGPPGGGFVAVIGRKRKTT
jgi:cyanuric acid amidohydrolase